MARNFREKLNRKLDLLCAPSSSSALGMVSPELPADCLHTIGGLIAGVLRFGIYEKRKRPRAAR